jgi:heptosyltransferase I
MQLPLSQPPASLCLLRLSAIGDISHTVPIVRTLQRTWPDCRITWVIGRVESELVAGMEGVEFIVVDKRGGWREGLRLWRLLRQRRFDLLLHMQMALRASLISLLIKSPIRLGFDRQRAKDLQWLFTNHTIKPAQGEHVIETFFAFTAALGIAERHWVWQIPIPPAAVAFANQAVPRDRPLLVIAPCSAHSYRNWLADRYAAVARHAVEHLGMAVVICGGKSRLEREFATTIKAAAPDGITDLVGQTDLKQLLAILSRACLVVAPDSGPAHLATAVGVPVVGLYAATNPDRARPYMSQRGVVNCYPAAIAQFARGDDRWGRRVRHPEAMALIGVEAVIAKIEELLPCAS